jgi:hypothetical protein
VPFTESKSVDGGERWISAEDGGDNAAAGLERRVMARLPAQLRRLPTPALGGVKPLTFYYSGT